VTEEDTWASLREMFSKRFPRIDSSGVQTKLTGAGFATVEDLVGFWSRQNSPTDPAAPARMLVEMVGDASLTFAQAITVFDVALAIRGEQLLV